MTAKGKITAAQMSPAQRAALEDMACHNLPVYDRRVGEALVRRGWATRHEEVTSTGRVVSISYQVTVEGITVLVEWATKNWSAGRLARLIDRVKPAVEAASRQEAATLPVGGVPYPTLAV